MPTGDFSKIAERFRSVAILVVIGDGWDVSIQLGNNSRGIPGMNRGNRGCDHEFEYKKVF